MKQLFKGSTYCVNFIVLVSGEIKPVCNWTWNIFMDVIWKKKEEEK